MKNDETVIAGTGEVAVTDDAMRERAIHAAAMEQMLLDAAVDKAVDFTQGVAPITNANLDEKLSKDGAMFRAAYKRMR